ncbi:MAG: YraN family protein [Lachnospiraceae bacterium]|nr:YraN family protein [Lachnospiraceae bacterium]
MNNRKTGTHYETLVAKVLKKHGYQILEINFRNRIGEVDLIAVDGSNLVFVEVKYRKTVRMGAPEEAVTRNKQRIICRVADYYILTHPEVAHLQMRFDVAAIDGKHLTIYKNAFEYQWRKSWK